MGSKSGLVLELSKDFPGSNAEVEEDGSGETSKRKKAVVSSEGNKQEAAEGIRTNESLQEASSPRLVALLICSRIIGNMRRLKTCLKE